MAIPWTRRSMLAGMACGTALALVGCKRADRVRIGLITALSAQSAKAGEAISRGLAIAIDEINAAGGLLGKPLELIRRDDESNPGKGVIAARELIHNQGVSILFGGLDTPVARAIVPIATSGKVPFVVPWAAGTAITHNGTDPNFVFRVSAVDELVDKAIVNFARRTYGARRPGVILLNNPWGQSNEKGLKAALLAAAIPLAGSEKFEHSDVDVTPQLGRLRAAGADCLMMVATVGPSAQVVKSLDQMGWRVPIVSHWGPAGGRFGELAGPNADRVKFVQTYSFMGADSPVKTRVMTALMAKYPDVKGPQDVTPSVGVANAYDAMHLAALAIRTAGSLDGEAVRQGFARIDRYDGLIKSYHAPFAGGNHDALGEDDYIWAEFRDGRIVPVTSTVGG